MKNFLVTHCCGLQNKPVAILFENETNGTLYFKTDHSRSSNFLQNFVAKAKI